MVSGYDCSNRKRWWWRTNVPPLRAIYDGHADALEQYGVHRLIQHDQGFTRSHWMPPSGNYLLRIAHAATRVTINKTSMENVPTLLAILMAIPMQGYNTAHIAQWRRFVAFMEATKHCHQASTHSDIIKGTHQLRLFWKFHQEKGLKLTCWPLITIGVWHIKLMRSN